MHRLRFILTPAAILLLLAAFCHCAWEWNAELSHRHTLATYRAAGLPVPIGLPVPGCDDETGCICRGATVATPIDVRGLASTNTLWQWLELPPAVQFYDAEAVVQAPLPAECLAPPISGRQLRALYASLVI
jgi:hypothetical protein